MAKTLIWAEGSPTSVKIGDTNTSLYLQIAKDNVNVDLTTLKIINVKVRSKDSFVKTISITSDDIQSIPGVIQVPLNTSNIGGLPDGDYYFEVWVTTADDESEIYPDVGVAKFSIVNNVESGATAYTSLTLQDFEDRFTEQYNKTEQTYETGKANMAAFNQATADLKQAQTDLSNGGYAKTADMSAALAGKTDTSVTATKADKSYVDTMLESIAQGGPKGIYYSLSALQTAYPSGTSGTYLVLDSSYTDGAHSFIWDNSSSSWVDLGLYESSTVRYSDVNDHFDNLWDGGVVKFGSATVSSSNGVLSVTVTKTNDGMITSFFDSNSAKTTILIKGNKTQATLDVQLVYVNSAGTQKYVKLGTVTGENIDQTFSFDATYQKVYNDAQKFRILIQCNDAAPSGSFSVTDLEIHATSSFQQSSEYDSNLLNILSNILTKLDENSGDIAGLLSQTSPILTDSNSTKYRLTVSSGSIALVKTIPAKVLFLGNSILLGLDTDGTSGGAFGMCASDYQHDYAYLTEQAILAKNSSATFNKLHDAPFEQAEDDTTAQNYIKTNKSLFTSDLDLVIIQIGDNVNNSARITTFTNNLPSLISQIKSSSPNARILLVGVWFDGNGVSSIMQNVAKSSDCEFVSISSLNTATNQAVTGGTITFKNGSTLTIPDKYASHPGDNGHAAIANTIISRLNM